MSALAAVDNATIRSLNPITGDVVGEVPVMSAAEVDAVVAEAHHTAAEWGALDARERAAALLRVRQALVDRSRELAETISAETGKPHADAVFEVVAACTHLTYALRHANRALRRRRVPTSPVLVKRAWVEYSPYGVVAAITPWNYPVGIPFQILPFATAAGNTVVMKPSELTPVTGQIVAEVFAASGHELVRAVTGEAVTGEALVRSDVGKIAFTGSAATGRHILRTAADNLTPVVLELGGKDPMIVTDGADVARAARSAVGGTFSNSGQTCMAIERVFTTPGAYGPFVDAALAATAELRQGTAPSDHVGSLTQPGAAARIEKIVRRAEEQGARVLTGGKRRSDLGEEFFEPTVLVDVDPSMDLMAEETFGPVLPIVKVRSVEEAVRLANDCDYGLSSSVFADDASEARTIASRLMSGSVNVDDALVGSGIPALPFGGVKNSGFGRLQGEEGLREFSHARSVVESRFPRLPGLAAGMFTGNRPDPNVVHRGLGAVYSVGIRAKVAALVGRRS
ncbi:MAG: aldehyde dehydrogenase family protein [Acidimicrobiia bacterium]